MGVINTKSSRINMKLDRFNCTRTLTDGRQRRPSLAACILATQTLREANHATRPLSVAVPRHQGESGSRRTRARLEVGGVTVATLWSN